MSSMTALSSNSAVSLSGEDSGSGGVSSPSGGATLPSSWTEVVRRGIEPDSTVRNLVVSDPVTAADYQSPVADFPAHLPVVDLTVPSPAVDFPAYSPVMYSSVPSPAVDLPISLPEVDFPAPSTVMDASVVDFPVPSLVVDLPVPSPEVDLPSETRPEGSCGSGSCNGSGELRSVWSKPSVDCVTEGTSSPVMGDSLWPALSDSTRTGAKALSVCTESSSNPTEAPAILQPPQKQVKPNLNPNHVRQRPTRHVRSVGGANVNYNQPPPQPPLPPPFPLFDIYGNLVPAVTEFPQPPYKTNNWTPRSSNKNPARRNNFGPRPVNIGYSGRRDHLGPPGPLVRGFVPPPFIPHQSLRPHVAPIGYKTGASLPPYAYVPVPLLPYGALPYWDSLHVSILKQIEYYFSDENLVKDNFLRSHMDDEGWVPITLIAGFQRVKKLTNDLQMILRSLTYSNTVEIQGDKVRRRADWRKWTRIPREVLAVEASFQKLKLHDGLTKEKEVLVNGE